MNLRPQGPDERGRLVDFRHSSVLLENNALGDPSRRAHPVYLPPGYDESEQHYPVLWCLAAYTNAGPGQVAWRNHGENLPARLDRMIAAGQLPPVIAVFPDCYTSLGGNQYVDSPAMGQYASFLCDELVPAIDQEFRTIADPAARAVFGKSSGGFGALHLAMTRPGVWSAVASHAGDCGFDRVYLRDFPVCCDVLARYDGDVSSFIQAFWRANKADYRGFHAMMTLCLAASYSPDPECSLGLALPFELETCQLDEEIWRRWLGFDPVCRIHGAQAEALGSLAGLWIDVGNRDQYFLHYGTRQLHRKLGSAGIRHHFEEFDGTHSGIDWRFDHSLPWLAECLKLD